MTTTKSHLTTLFFFSVVLILGFAFDTKLITLLVDGRLLHSGNPLFGVSEGAVLKIACLIEAAVMAGLFFARSVAARAWTTLWVCVAFAGYRLALLAYPHASCSCFGRLSDWIGVGDPILERIQMGCLAYMFAGSFAIVLLDRSWRGPGPAADSQDNPGQPRTATAL